MTEPVVIGPCRLYLGDCRDVLPTLSGIDAVLFDPPYGINHTSSYGASWQDTEIENDGDTAVRDWVVRWATENGLPWSAFGSWKRPKPAGVRACLVWDKGPAFGMGDLSLPWKPSWEELYIGGDGWSGKRDEGVMRGPVVVSWESKGRVHPHQKPTWIYERLIQKLPAARVICDPTLGSGTGAVATCRLGREFVGIECDQEAFDIACRRIREAVSAERSSLFPAYGEGVA